MSERDSDGYVIVDNEMIERAATPAGGWTKAQLAAIGVDWPPIKGWKRSVIGKTISRSAFNTLMSEGARGEGVGDDG